MTALTTPRYSARRQGSSSVWGILDRNTGVWVPASDRHEAERFAKQMNGVRALLAKVTTKEGDRG